MVAIPTRGSVMALPAQGATGASKAALEALLRRFAPEPGGRDIGFDTLRKAAWA